MPHAPELTEGMRKAIQDRLEARDDVVTGDYTVTGRQNVAGTPRGGTVTLSMRSDALDVLIQCGAVEPASKPEPAKSETKPVATKAPVKDAEKEGS